MIQIIPSLQQTESRTALKTEQSGEVRPTQFMQDFALLLEVLFRDEAPKESAVIPTENTVLRNATKLPDIMMESDAEEGAVEEPKSSIEKDSSPVELVEEVDSDELEEVTEPEEEERLDSLPKESAAQIQYQPIVFNAEPITPIQTDTIQAVHDSTRVMKAVPPMEQPLEIKEQSLAHSMPFVYEPIDPEESTLEEKAGLKLPYPTDDSVTDDSIKRVLVDRPGSLEMRDTQAAPLVQRHSMETELPKMEDQALDSEIPSINLMEAADESQSIIDTAENTVKQPFVSSQPDTTVSLETDLEQTVPFITVSRRESQVRPSSSLLPDAEEVNVRDGTVTVEEQAVTAEPLLETKTLATDTAQEPDKDNEVQDSQTILETKSQQVKPKEVKGKNTEFKSSELSVSLDSPVVQNSSEQIVESMPVDDEISPREMILDLEETERITPKLTERLQTLINEERSEVRIQLKPESLGELKIKVSLEQGVVSAEFMVESETVREIIAANLPQLRSSLHDMGTNVSQLAVNIDTGQKDSQDDPAHRLWERRTFNSRQGSRNIGAAAEAAAGFARSNRSWNQVDLKA